MIEQKNKARQEAGQKLQSDSDFTATDAERRLVAAMLCRTDSYFRSALARIAPEKRHRVADPVFDLAQRYFQIRGHGPTTEGLFDFAWYLNDRATDLNERDRYRQHRKCPPYGAAIARQRSRGRVPVPVRGYHATIALAPQYRRAAPEPDLCLLARPGGEIETYDFRFLAGLQVLILAVGDEYGPARWLTRTLVADGVETVHVRLLNHPKLADEQLYPEKGLSWAA